MAAKKTKTRSVAKKTTETMLKSSQSMTDAATAPMRAATSAFTQFPSFAKMPSFSQMPSFSPMASFPQFQPFKMENAMDKGTQQFDKAAQTATVNGQEQMDALMQCSTIFARGMEDIIKTCVEICQNVGEKSSGAAKTIMSCKTLNEFTEAQTRLAQSSMDDMMTNVTRLSEMSVKLCTEVMQPINDQFGRTMKRTSRAA